jgi:hypothetical protein
MLAPIKSADNTVSITKGRKRIPLKDKKPEKISSSSLGNGFGIPISWRRTSKKIAKYPQFVK